MRIALCGWIHLTLHAIYYFAGCHWDSIYTSPNHDLLCHRLLNDRLPMDSSQIFLVYILYVHVLRVFYHVRDDGCCSDPWSPDCCHCFLVLLWILEYLLRISHHSTCKINLLFAFWKWFNKFSSLGFCIALNGHCWIGIQIGIQYHVAVNSCVVEVVLLGQSCCMDTIWSHYFSTWRFDWFCWGCWWKGCRACETIFGRLFWI